MNVWLDFTSLTLNWINRNLKFICYPFEVCIKISKSLQAWSTGLQEICICVCFQHIKPGLCCTGTGRCSKKVCFAFSLVHRSFSNNFDYSAYNFSTKFYFYFFWIFLDFLVSVNIHVIKLITWTLTDLWHIIFSSDPTDIWLCVRIGIGYKCIVIL